MNLIYMTAEEAEEKADNSEVAAHEAEMKMIMGQIEAAAAQGQYYIVVNRVAYGKTLKILRDLGYDVGVVVMPDQVNFVCIKWGLGDDLWNL